MKSLKMKSLALSASVLVILSQARPTSADLTNYYDFETGSGTNVVDSAGSTDGTWVDTGGGSANQVFDTDTPTDLSASTRSLSFGGANRVSLSDATAGKPSGSPLAFAEGAVSVWFNASNVTGTHYFFGNQNFGPDGERVYHQVRDGTYIGNLDGSDAEGGFAGSEVGSQGGIGTGEWHHSVLVWNPDGSGDVYLDGNLLGSLSAGTITFTDNNRSVSIGARSTSTTDDWEGLLDDVAIFDRALSVGEARAIATIPGLGLGHDAIDVNKIIEQHNLGSGVVEVDGQNWTFIENSSLFEGRTVGEAFLFRGAPVVFLDADALSGMQVIVPEPGSGLIALGLLALMARRRRSARRAAA